MGMIVICYFSHTNCVFHIIQEVGVERKKYPYNTHLPYEDGYLTSIILQILDNDFHFSEKLYLHKNVGCWGRLLDQGLSTSNGVTHCLIGCTNVMA